MRDIKIEITYCYRNKPTLIETIITEDTISKEDEITLCNLLDINSIDNTSLSDIVDNMYYIQAYQDGGFTGHSRVGVNKYIDNALPSFTNKHREIMNEDGMVFDYILKENKD